MRLYEYPRALEFIGQHARWSKFRLRCNQWSVLLFLSGSQTPSRRHHSLQLGSLGFDPYLEQHRLDQQHRFTLFDSLEMDHQSNPQYLDQHLSANFPKQTSLSNKPGYFSTLIQIRVFTTKKVLEKCANIS